MDKRALKEALGKVPIHEFCSEEFIHEVLGGQSHSGDVDAVRDGSHLFYRVSSYYSEDDKVSKLLDDLSRDSFNIPGAGNKTMKPFKAYVRLALGIREKGSPSEESKAYFALLKSK